MNRIRRPAIPTRLQILRGDPGKRAKRRAQTEPVPAGGVPRCPKWLNKEARAEWRRIVKAMPAGVITQADGAILAACCEAWSDYVALIAGKSSLPGRKDARASWLRLARELGLTPSSRAGLVVPLGAPDDVGADEGFARKKA